MTQEIPTLFIFVTPQIHNDTINHVYNKLKELQNPMVFGAQFENEIDHLKARFDKEKTWCWNEKFEETTIDRDDAFFGMVGEERDDISEFVKGEVELSDELKKKYYVQPVVAIQKDVICSKDYYDYNEYFVPERDWMLINISRPSNEPSFTTVIKEFSKVGYEPLFGYFFFSNQWGLLKGDYDFLAQLWEHKGMEGPYDWKTVRDKYIAKTYPSANALPEESPMVFRGDFKKLVRQLEESKLDMIESQVEPKKIKS